MGQATVLGMAEKVFLPQVPGTGHWETKYHKGSTGGISSLTASTVEPLLGLFQPFLKSLPHTFLSPYLAPPWPASH